MHRGEKRKINLKNKIMSYNIDTFKIKKLENLIIPLSAFYQHERKDWHPKQPKIINDETMEVELQCGCEQSIKGILKDGNIHVTKLHMYGEGSGTFMSWIFNPALQQSTGQLEAVCVWEGGDSVTRLIVKDGKVKEENVEL